MIRVQIAILQEGQGVPAAPAQQAPEPTNGLPQGHPLKPFEEECLTVSEWAEANCGSVARRYHEWSATQEGHTKLNHIKFAKSLSAVFKRKGCPNRVVYTGVTLKPPISETRTPASHEQSAPNAVTNSDEEDIALPGQHIGSDLAGKQLDSSPI